MKGLSSTPSFLFNMTEQELEQLLEELEESLHPQLPRHKFNNKLKSIWNKYFSIKGLPTEEHPMYHGEYLE